MFKHIKSNIFSDKLPALILSIGTCGLLVTISIILFNNDKAVFAIVGSLIGVFGSRQLERDRRKEKEKEISKLLSVIVQEHEDFLELAKFCLEEILEQQVHKNLNSNLFQLKAKHIKEDQLYKKTLAEIGVLQTKNIEIVYEYSKNLNSIMDFLLEIKDKSIVNYEFVKFIKIRVDFTKVLSKICVMTLIKELSEEKEKFISYQKAVELEYRLIKESIDQEETILGGVIEVLYKELRLIERFYQRVTDLNILDSKEIEPG